MKYKYVVAHRYNPGCGLHHQLFCSKEEATDKITHLMADSKVTFIELNRLSENCIYTFHPGFSTTIFEVLLVDEDIHKAPIGEHSNQTGKRSSQFWMTLAHAKTRPDLYPWAVTL